MFYSVSGPNSHIEDDVYITGHSLLVPVLGVTLRPSSPEPDSTDTVHS